MTSPTSGQTKVGCNAACESFFHTLKVELVYQQRFRTRREASTAIFEYIETYYNRLRRHSAIDYAIPEAYRVSEFSGRFNMS